MYLKVTYSGTSLNVSIANYLGSNHTTYTCNKQDVLDIIPQLPRAFSEPFADSSQIPTMLVAKEAKQEVTVALTGDGGDELFGGYNRYLIANNYSNSSQHFSSNYSSLSSPFK